MELSDAQRPKRGAVQRLLTFRRKPRRALEPDAAADNGLAEARVETIVAHIGEYPDDDTERARCNRDLRGPDAAPRGSRGRL